MNGSVSSFRKSALLSIFSFFLFACGNGGGGAGSVPPSAPTLVPVPSDSKVTLSWDPVAGAISYNLYRAKAPGVTKANYFTLPEAKLYSDAKSPLSDGALTNGASYSFVVTAVNAAGESVESAEVSSVPTADVALPSVPTDVDATAGNGTVALAWRASGATGYFVYMAERSGVTRNNWNTISGGKRTQVLSGSTFYLQTGLTNGTTYYFVITSSNSLGQSSESMEVSATPLFSTTIPRNLSASPGDQKVTLTWEPADGATSYRLYWLERTPGQSPQCPPASNAAPVVTPSNGNKIENVTAPYLHDSLVTQTPTGLTNGNTYYYIVASVNGVTESLPSKQACAAPTPLPPPTVVTLSPSSVTKAGAATLNGKINPNGFPIIDAYFEYGPTTAYGSKAQIPNPASIGSGSAFISKDASITGLNSNQVYHYRAVAKNGNPGGTSVGDDQSFVLPYLGAALEYSIGVGAASPNEVVLADFGGDGKRDIATANYGSNDVSVLIQAPDGTFGPAARYPVGHNPQHLAFGHFNGDGKADLIVSNHADGTISLLLNNGTGGFAAAVPITLSINPPAFPAGLVVDDFNHDSKPDVAVAAAVGGIGKVAVLLGDGAGGFSPPLLYDAGVSPSGIEAGDFDHDGALDLVVTNLLTNKLSLLLGVGNGTFVVPPVFFPDPTQNYGPIAVASNDFDGDTVPDLAVADNASGTLSIFLNDGSGVFSAPTNFAVGSQPHAVEAADIDGDNRPDLIVPNFKDDSVTVYMGAGGADFGASFVSLVGLNPVAAAAADLDGDGKMDLVVANVSGNSVSVLFGQ
jgi:hypothetical protein